jgi:hypothetical protein
MPDLAILVCCAVRAVWAFWQLGRPVEADFLPDVYRSFSLDRAWQARQLFPRLGMDLAFGYGAPPFQYYPPAGSYITLAFRWLGLGWVEATKMAFTLALGALASLIAFGSLSGIRPPPDRWPYFSSEQELPLPADLPPGAYRLLVGMYRAEDVRNLPVRLAPAVLPGDRLDLGLIEVGEAP